MSNIFDELCERGYVEQTTDDESLRKVLGNEHISFYIAIFFLFSYKLQLQLIQ